ncbi:MAG TPA: hypothetical protein VGH88_13955 [Streptosporangiaceae bacterium]
MHLRTIALSLAALAAGALSLAATGPAGASLARLAAPAASTEFGSSCFDLSSQALGPGSIQRHFGPGSGVRLQPGSRSGLTEDFTSETVGTLGELCADGRLPASAYVCGNPAGQFPPSQVVREWNWAPDGNETGSCEGVAAERSGQRLLLQACGLPRPTDLWVPDYGRGTGQHACLTGRYCAWYSAAAAKPLVLRVTTTGPADQLEIYLSTGSGTAPARQLFCSAPGPYSPAC